MNVRFVEGREKMRTCSPILYGVLAICLLSGCASTEGKGAAKANYDFSSLDKIAVVTIEGRMDSEAAKQQLTDMINTELLSKGFSPVERQQMLGIMEERGLQSTELTDPVSLAKLLNVSGAIIINVPRYEGEMAMSAKLVSVSDASILWSATGTATTGKTLNTLTGGILGAGAGASAGAVGAGRTGSVLAGAAGGGVGALTGAALTPEKEEQARKLITKLFETFPSR